MPQVARRGIEPGTAGDEKTIGVDEGEARTFVEKLEQAVKQTKCCDDVTKMVIYSKAVLSSVGNGKSEPQSCGARPLRWNL